jgi:hypothetical protein
MDTKLIIADVVDNNVILLDGRLFVGGRTRYILGNVTLLEFISWLNTEQYLNFTHRGQTMFAIETKHLTKL